jgi:hypothetical protein
MWLIIAALLVGIIMGYCGLLSAGLQRFTGNLTVGGIILLLFAMGGQIGSDQQLRAGLGQMGLQAVFFAAAAIGGSIVAVKLLEKVLPFGGSSGERGTEV